MDCPPVTLFGLQRVSSIKFTAHTPGTFHYHHPYILVSNALHNPDLQGIITVLQCLITTGLRECVCPLYVWIAKGITHQNVWCQVVNFMEQTLCRLELQESSP